MQSNEQEDKFRNGCGKRNEEEEKRNHFVQYVLSIIFISWNVIFFLFHLAKGSTFSLFPNYIPFSLSFRFQLCDFSPYILKKKEEN